MVLTTCTPFELANFSRTEFTLKAGKGPWTDENKILVCHHKTTMQQIVSITRHLSLDLSLYDYPQLGHEKESW